MGFEPTTPFGASDFETFTEPLEHTQACRIGTWPEFREWLSSGGARKLRQMGDLLGDMRLPAGFLQLA